MKHEPNPGDVACTCGKPFLYCYADAIASAFAQHRQPQPATDANAGPTGTRRNASACTSRQIVPKLRDGQRAQCRILHQMPLLFASRPTTTQTAPDSDHQHSGEC